VNKTTCPATGSVASVSPAKSTSGVEPANFDQLLPFHNQVAAPGARPVPQTAEELPVVVPFAFAGAVGTGAVSGIVALGGSTGVFELDDPDDPEPDEHAIGWFAPAASSVPTRITSWLAGSYVICALSKAGDAVAGCCWVHPEPSHVQVSSRPPDLL
jgi:hypothetical protein